MHTPEKLPQPNDMPVDPDGAARSHIAPYDVKVGIGSTEVYNGHEAQSHKALLDAVDDFALYRGKQVLRQYGEGDDIVAKTKGYETMHANYAFLDDVESEGQAERSIRPAMTVCMPVALKENPEDVLRTVGLLQRSQEQLGNPVEVILWVNTFEGDPQLEAGKYDALRNALSEGSYPGLQLTTALQVTPKEQQHTISKVRADYMEAVAIRSLEKGYGFEHPVMWIDADMAFISKSALAAIEDKVRHFEALIVHPSLNYSVDWAAGKAIADMDVATKAVVVNEVQRRMLARAERSDEIRRYVEESGFSLAIGTYLKSHGVDRSRQISETSHVIDRVRWMMEEGAVVPDFLLLQGNNQPRLRTQVTAARMGMSARRPYKLVQEHGTVVLEDVDGEHYNGMLLPKKTDGITAEDVAKLLDRNRREDGYLREDERLPQDPKAAQKAAFIERVLRRYFSEVSDK